MPKTYHLPKHTILYRKLIRAIFGSKPPTEPLTKQARKDLYKEQAAYIFSLRLIRQEKILNRENGKQEFEISNFLKGLQHNEYCPLNTEIDKLQRKHDRQIEKLTKRAEKDFEYRHTDEYKKEFEKKTSKLLVKLKKQQEKIDRNNGITHGIDVDDSEFELQEKGYRKSETVILANIQIYENELEKLMTEIKLKSGDFTSSEIAEKKLRIQELGKRIAADIEALKDQDDSESDGESGGAYQIPELIDLRNRTAECINRSVKNK